MFDNRSLQLILMPTEQCNFRCTYCFEEFRNGRMAPGIVKGVKRLLDRRAGELDHLATDWFGGEPLLAVNIVEEIQLHVLDLATRFPRIQTSSYMTTNGYHMTPTMLRRLFDIGVRRFQIALDGPREFHDKKRTLAGGQATFHRIWENLLAARGCDEEFAITIRLQIDRENRGSIVGLIERLHSVFGDDRRIGVAPILLVCLDPAGKDASSFLSGTEGESALEEAQSRVRSLWGQAEGPCEQQPRVCYAARPDSLIVRSDGTLAKCVVALRQRENRVGRLDEDGRVELDASAMTRWMRGLWSRDEQELSCPMHGIEQVPKN